MLVSRGDEQGSTHWVPAEVHPQPLTWLLRTWDLSTHFPTSCTSSSLSCAFGSSWSTDWLSLACHEESLGGAEQCLPPRHFRHWLKKAVRSQISHSGSPFKGLYLCSVIFKALVKGFNVDKGLQHDGNRMCTGQCEIKINVRWNKKEMFVFLSPFLPRSSAPLPPSPLHLSELHQPLVLQKLIHCCLFKVSSHC